MSTNDVVGLLAFSSARLLQRQLRCACADQDVVREADEKTVSLWKFEEFCTPLDQGARNRVVDEHREKIRRRREMR